MPCRWRQDARSNPCRVNARTPLLLCLLTLKHTALAAPGDVEPGNNPLMNSTVRALLWQSDGSLLAGGDFTSAGGAVRSRLCRFTAAGSLDEAFNPGADGPVHCLAAQADGRLLAGGEFSLAGGQLRNNLARFSPDGAADPAFNPDMNSTVRCLELHDSDWIYTGGNFSRTGGVLSNRFVRLTENGVRDAAYAPDVTFNTFSAALQPDGRMLIGGFFNTVGGVTRSNLARLLASGAVDTDFAPSADDIVRGLLVQPDGRIIIAGNFALVNGVSRSRIARLLSNGTLDTTFNPSVTGGDIYSCALQTDGRILLGGSFTAVGGISRQRLARLSPTGSLDTTFNASADGSVYALLLRPDGKVEAGGQFTAINGTPRGRLARLSNDAATQSLTVPDIHRIQWLRGGASPEINGASFDLSADGGVSWAPLGSGICIAGGWELTGLTLPLSGQVRARARILCGYGNGSSSLIESVAAYTGSPLQFWRHAHFGTAANAGPAADHADPDKDGLENLVEFAFSLDPNTPDAAALPQWQLEDDDYSLTFTRPAGVDGITYIAEYSTSMAPGSWISAVNISMPPAYQFYAPAIAQRQYVRVRVTSP